MPGAKVSKALSQEEQTILANIKSLVDQMESLEAGEADYEEEQQPVEESMDSEEDAYDEVDKEYPKEDEDVDKAEDEEMTPLDKVMRKVSEGEDLSDEDRKMISSALESIDKSEGEDMPDRKKVDKAAKIEAQNAEDRLEYGKPEETDEAMQAMKALARMILGQQTAQKSAQRRPVQKSAPSKELLEMKRLVQKNSRAIESMLEGFGLADEIKKSAPVSQSQEVRKNRGQAPVGNTDGEVVKLLREIVAKGNEGQSKSSEEQDHGTEIRKGLSESLPSIFGVRQ